ncbi:MAG: hypothetical protein IJL30_04965 [Clostridia bacterium]|nr:hypothetical protein [Clostridia bacterium]
MKKYLIFLTVFVFILASGCGDGEIKDTDPVEKTPYSVQIETAYRSYTAEDGMEIIYINAEYPKIVNTEEDENIAVFNEMYRQNADDYIDAVIADFSERAKNTYAESPEDFEEYLFTQQCSVTFNKNGYLSIKRDYTEEYEDFKGEETYADVYDMTEMRALYANEVISSSAEDTMQIIFLGYTSVAEEYPERFKEGYTDIINSAIKETEFYLTDTAMVFVMQPGIATYPEYGCLMFEMPYEGNETFFKKILDD